MLKGFRDFIARGNIVDLASAVIIGVAFSAIVDSLVKDIITPIIGMLGGQPDFAALKIGAVAIGNFVNAIVGHITHGDVARFGCGEVNVVHPNAIADNDFAIFQMCDDFRRNRCPLHE